MAGEDIVPGSASTRTRPTHSPGVPPRLKVAQCVSSLYGKCHSVPSLFPPESTRSRRRFTPPSATLLNSPHSTGSCRRFTLPSSTRANSFNSTESTRWSREHQCAVSPTPNKSEDDGYDVCEKLEGTHFDAYGDITVDVTGSDVPDPVKSFADIDFGEALQENIKRCRYVKPTPIQRHAMPIAVSGRDLMACAQTGSGKTAAFCFPVIAGILKTRVRSRVGRVACPTALVLSPTRELTCQIHEEAIKFTNQTGIKVAVAYGGAPISPQLCILEKGVDILVATPGRLIDMLERGRVLLNKISYLTIDEADRMLDMGFEHQIRKIVEQFDMPSSGKRQTMLFSATFPDQIQRLASDFLSNYIFLAVGKVGSSTGLIEQRVTFVHDMDKRNYLMDLLRAQDDKFVRTLIFVETKRGADALENWLSVNGFPATAIHGDKVQWEREEALRSFKSGATPILVATDIASRGLDVPKVSHVINFDLPKGIDDYVHRIGRTGRAGKSGSATAFFTHKDLPLAKALVELMEEAKQEVPSWLSEYAENSFCSVQNHARHYGGFKSSSPGGQDSCYTSNQNDADSPGATPPFPTISDDEGACHAEANCTGIVDFRHGYESTVACGWE